MGSAPLHRIAGYSQSCRSHDLGFPKTRFSLFEHLSHRGRDGWRNVSTEDALLVCQSFALILISLGSISVHVCE